MADVSVEFGAVDVGLEKTLKQVQAEMTNLEGKVKSGELTMTELESTMKRLGQVQNLEKKLQSIGAESAGASPKVDALSKDIKGAGDAADKTGSLFDLSFAKVAAATAVGNVAAKAFTAVIDGAFAAARATGQTVCQAGQGCAAAGQVSQLTWRPAAGGELWGPLCSPRNTGSSDRPTEGELRPIRIVPAYLYSRVGRFLTFFEF